MIIIRRMDVDLRKNGVSPIVEFIAPQITKMLKTDSIYPPINQFKIKKQRLDTGSFYTCLAEDSRNWKIGITQKALGNFEGYENFSFSTLRSIFVYKGNCQFLYIAASAQSQVLGAISTFISFICLLLSQTGVNKQKFASAKRAKSEPLTKNKWAIKDRE